MFSDPRVPQFFDPQVAISVEGGPGTADESLGENVRQKWAFSHGFFMENHGFYVSINRKPWENMGDDRKPWFFHVFPHEIMGVPI